ICNATKHTYEQDQDHIFTTTVYINPTTTKVRHWLDAGRCPWCGSECPSDQCRARKCTSCTSVWLSETPADVSDGYQLTEEYCPPCQVWLNSYHAVNPANPTHVLCGSVRDPDIKVTTGSGVTCAECSAVWDKLHLMSQAYSAPVADRLETSIAVQRQTAESTAERKNEHVHSFREVPNSQRTDSLRFACTMKACDCGEWY